MRSSVKTETLGPDCGNVLSNDQSVLPVVASSWFFIACRRLETLTLEASVAIPQLTPRLD